MGLPEPRSADGARGVARLLQAPSSALMAFDFDGVLSPIVDDPEKAYAHPAVVPALARIAPVVGAVAVVTGRPAQTAVRLGGFDRVPELAGMTVIGQYGVEVLDAPNGELHTTEPHPGLGEVRSRLPGLLTDLGAPEGVRVEDKGHAVVVHTRRAADPAGTLDRLSGPLQDLAAANGLAAEAGRLVLELRPPGTDKGAAIRALVAELEPQIVFYVGDDRGDLPAFDAVDGLRAEGLCGVLVAVTGTDHPGEVPRELIDRADLLVDGPAGVAAMLDGLSDRLRA